jgi:hypothetical protein
MLVVVQTILKVEETPVPHQILLLNKESSAWFKGIFSAGYTIQINQQDLNIWKYPA